MLELRPKWCVDDSVLRQVIEFGPWMDEHGKRATSRSGDDWAPGHGLRLTRDVRLLVDARSMRRKLNLQSGAVVGVAARWACRSTSMAGVHDEGPRARPLVGDTVLAVSIPSVVAGSLEIETCLVIGWQSGLSVPGKCPEGGLIWSDGWFAGPGESLIILEGSELRVPVQTTSFKDRFGEDSDSLWSINLDLDIRLDDLMANVVTVFINQEVLMRDFRNSNGEPDASLLPAMTRAGISVDLLYLMTRTLKEELLQIRSLDDFPEGSVGQILCMNLRTTVGSIEGAVQSLDNDPSKFLRLLWSHCSPDSWSGR